jgi:hypothetical protein
MEGRAVQQSFGQVVVDQAQSEWSRIKAADEQRRARAAMEALQREEMLAANATPETLAKARSSVVERMWERGQMGSEQLRAATEIARVFQAVGCELHARTSRYGNVSGGGGDWPVSLGVAYRERYTPWRTEQGAILGGGGKTNCELVFALVVDNQGPRMAADRFGMDQRTLKNAVCESLYRYAEMAGWFEAKKVPDNNGIHTLVKAA